MKRKNIVLITAVILIGILAIQSCKKEAAIPPTLVVIAMPDVPSPAVGDILPFTGSGQTVTLTWTGAGSGTTVWDVFYGTKSSPALVASNVAANSYTVTLTKGGKYYWQVSTTDANMENTTSPVWSFQVNSNPAVPSGPVPAANAIGVSKSVRLSWIDSDPENNALTYDVFLDKTTNPSTSVATGTSDTTFAVHAPLSTNATYYWKVVAHDAFGGTSVSPIWKFGTTPNVITAFEGDYNADEPAEDYSYGVTFTAATTTTITTDNYWNSGWDATFTIDLTQKTFTMTSYTFDTGWTGVESGFINTSTGTMTGTYTLKKNGVIQEQGVHTYTKL